MSKYSSDSNSRDKTRSNSRYYSRRHRSTSSSSTESSKYSRKHQSKSRSDNKKHHKKSKSRRKSSSSSDYSSSRHKHSSRSHRKNESHSKRKRSRRNSSTTSESSHSSSSYSHKKSKELNRSKSSYKKEKNISTKSVTLPIFQANTSVTKPVTAESKDQGVDWLQNNVHDVIKRENSIELIKQEGFVFKVFKPSIEQKEETCLSISKLNDEIIKSLEVEESTFVISNRDRLLSARYKLLTKKERCNNWAKHLFASYKQLESNDNH